MFVEELGSSIWSGILFYGVIILAVFGILRAFKVIKDEHVNKYLILKVINKIGFVVIIVLFGIVWLLKKASSSVEDSGKSVDSSSSGGVVKKVVEDTITGGKVSKPVNSRELAVKTRKDIEEKYKRERERRGYDEVVIPKLVCNICGKSGGRSPRVCDRCSFTVCEDCSKKKKIGNNCLADGCRGSFNGVSGWSNLKVKEKLDYKKWRRKENYSEIELPKMVCCECGKSPVGHVSFMACNKCFYALCIDCFRKSSRTSRCDSCKAGSWVSVSSRRIKR